MKTSSRQNIVIIGCGNLAWHLAKHLASTRKFHITVYNHRNSGRLEDFKKQLKCHTQSSLSAIKQTADYYFICVSDQYIREVSRKINPKLPSAIVIHTSGSQKLSVLKKNLKRRAVFYPVQTFSKEDQIIWSETPVLTEAVDTQTEKAILKFAGIFTKKIFTMNSENRLRVHLAAVLANNFCNALYAEADKYLGEINDPRIRFNLILPLIEQTGRKLRRLSPAQAQTGPALRGDKKVMKSHLKLLSGQRDLKKIYRQMSKLIVKQHSAV
jgi:predicted short-subunit dehydrogenase-like oxidoreductase (DUF2520 family)